MTKEELNEIDKILSHVRSIDALMAWIIKSNANSKDLKKALIAFLLKRKRAAKVYFIN